MARICPDCQMPKSPVDECICDDEEQDQPQRREPDFTQPDEAA